MIEKVKETAKSGMQKAVQALKLSLARLHTGRAHPSLLESLRVSRYDQKEPLGRMATITATDSRTLLIEPWDKEAIPAIEKAIRTSDLGINPETKGGVIRVPLAALTEERRHEMGRLVKKEAEHACVSIRNYRQEANQQLKELTKKKLVTEDEARHIRETIQKVTDESIKEVDKIEMAKKEELMRV